MFLTEREMKWFPVQSGGTQWASSIYYTSYSYLFLQIYVFVDIRCINRIYSLHMYVYNDHWVHQSSHLPARWFLSICAVCSESTRGIIIVKLSFRWILQPGSFHGKAPELCFLHVSPRCHTVLQIARPLMSWKRGTIACCSDSISGGVWICEIGSRKVWDNVLQYVKAMLFLRVILISLIEVSLIFLGWNSMVGSACQQLRRRIMDMHGYATCSRAPAICHSSLSKLAQKLDSVCLNALACLWLVLNCQ